MRMFVDASKLTRTTKLAVWVLALALLSGCSPDAGYKSNLPYFHRFFRKELSENDSRSERAAKETIAQQNRQDIANILATMFGTPDDPQLPALGEVDLKSVIDINRVSMSAGKVKSDKSGQPAGLYREHCVHCHGITGNGLGPTAAFLNPYPRDFRKGTFKFKKTAKGQKPTHEDLSRLLYDGVAGTAMPSFKVLDADERESLVHYVKYLSFRGEVERKLIEEIQELDEGDRLVKYPSEKESDTGKYEAKLDRLRAIAAEVAQTWIDADGQATGIPERTPHADSDAKKAAIARGREIFYGPIANCVKCHGDSALGDGQLTDYDDWTKELDPDPKQIDMKATHEYMALGALKPRNIRPRNLRLGIYRGGLTPNDIYWRVVNGIDGTPMPGLTMKPQNEKGLSPDDVWDLVEYVRSLPYEALNKPDSSQPTIARDRM
ncbi:MAG: cytochrome c [Planctomycetota bacterium]